MSEIKSHADLKADIEAHRNSRHVKVTAIKAAGEAHRTAKRESNTLKRDSK